MKIKISQILGLLGFSLLTVPAQASFFYVPFDQLLAEAELIVTGEIIHKSYVKKETLNNWSVRNHLMGQMESKSKIKMGVFTDYELHVDEVFKGLIKVDIIDIEESGGCYDGICATSSADYYYEVGDRVFIFLKERADRPYYRSTRKGYTAYFLSDDGRIYRNPDKVKIINGSGFERTHSPKPTTLEEIRTLLAE
ncbi:hypothetical protein [Marinicella gelatinilytica]|uniref:hypothetical protein n=1 Tax=Marinicella gelatinilytica TaxID=2996017 RepID=UPI00226093EF|nr:hypothetical protein [Marinicella gelatinilytica]MCX7544877.1 hypothetical protein [Marinicella gelatinilytica]